MDTNLECVYMSMCVCVCVLHTGNWIPSNIRSSFENFFFFGQIKAKHFDIVIFFPSTHYNPNLRITIALKTHISDAETLNKIKSRLFLLLAAKS